MEKYYYFIPYTIYFRLHNELFGKYDGDFMLRPSEEVLVRTRGTLLDFPKKEVLVAIKNAFKTSTQLQGYGFVDEVSALYGLVRSMSDKTRHLFSLWTHVEQAKVIVCLCLETFTATNG